MELPTPRTVPDQGIKDKHRKLWALGDYGAVAREVIPSLGPILVNEAGIGPGDYVLDVAAGTGNAAIPAVATGASAVALDLTPELIELGKLNAPQGGEELQWVVGDAEDIPFESGTFDAVISCVGVMFAPNHGQAAAELARVTREGGTVALLNWTPEGFIGEMFKIMREYQVPAPPASPGPPMWGHEDYVASLMDGLLEGLVSRREVLTVKRFAEPDHFREFFKLNYGPAVGVYRGLGQDEERSAALDRELSGLAERYARSTEDGMEMDWEYLLLRGSALGS